MIYQLRLPAATGLNGLFKRIVKALELNLGRPLSPQLRAAVAADLEKHILAFDTCGNSSLCDEATVPAPWNKGYEDYLLSSNPLDQAKVLRFHLQLPGESLPAFAGALARYVDQHLPNSDASHRNQAAQAIVDILAPYLFVGEICRKTELCNSAEPRPVKIDLEAAQ
jgi:hypothetical protein